MLRRPTQLFTGLLAGGLITWAAAPAFAQSINQEGIIRISDSSPAASGTPAPATIQPVPESGAYYGQPGEYSDCPDGRWGGRHGQNGRWFSPPVKRPIYRQGVSYYKNWPNGWAGTQGGPAPTNYQYPTVYMPTDTTQLGYYYQHVPYWQPRQGMVPVPPIPREWHTTVAESYYTGRHPAGKILGTAPTAIPIQPTPATLPSGANGPAVPLESVPATETPIESVIQPSAGLERADSTPSLIPIN
ncbi:hypothetical protein [Planctomicrobium sp. SH527]|uniref:hypothetical protein n=1 Tax=Planctomicrobium sp. SH527 TaxID=3448123 RepID=UPI003F5B0E57